MAAAYRGLPEQLKERVKGLTQTMDWQNSFQSWAQEAKRRSEREGDTSMLEHVESLRREYPPSNHPIVRRHPWTGELSIFANRGLAKNLINGVSAEESDQLLTTLQRMAERPEYQVRMRWRNPGDVCVYDNRCTYHYAVADYGEVVLSKSHWVLLGSLLSLS